MIRIWPNVLVLVLFFLLWCGLFFSIWVYIFMVYPWLAARPRLHTCERKKNAAGNGPPRHVATGRRFRSLFLFTIYYILKSNMGPVGRSWPQYSRQFAYRMGSRGACRYFVRWMNFVWRLGHCVLLLFSTCTCHIEIKSSAQCSLSRLRNVMLHGIYIHIYILVVVHIYCCHIESVSFRRHHYVELCFFNWMIILLIILICAGYVGA